MRKERSVLLETVDNLNGEIRQLNAKLQSLTQPEEEPSLEVTKEEILDWDSFEATEIHQMINETRSKTNSSIDEDYDPLMDQAVQEQSNHPMNQGNILNDSSHGEAVVGDEDNIENVRYRENAAKRKYVCPQCELELSAGSLYHLSEGVAERAKAQDSSPPV